MVFVVHYSLFTYPFQHPLDIFLAERHRRGVVDRIRSDHMRKFLVIGRLHWRFQFIQAAGNDQVGDGLQELVGGVTVVRVVVRQLAVTGHHRVFRKTSRLLVLQHGQHHQGDGLSVRDVVLGSDAVREGVYVARQLRIDGVAAIHRRAAHRQP